MAVVYSQALADRALAWTDRPLTAKRSAAGLAELAAIWSAIQGQPAGSCRQCQYSDYNASVAAYLRAFSCLQNPTTVSNLKYLLAAAFATQSLVHENYNKTVTADNLTDEDAEFFIKNGYAHAFVKADGTPVVAVDSTSDTKPDSEPDSEPDSDPRDYAKELEAEQKAHTATTAKLEKEQQAHTKASDALKAEKEAHKATKAENSELQKQVKELQKQLDNVAKAAETTPTAPAAASAPDGEAQ